MKPQSDRQTVSALVASGLVTPAQLDDAERTAAGDSRSVLEILLDNGTVDRTDVVRTAAGDGPGPYTWWSWRGKAFDNDSGWRIDYQLASAPVARTVTHASVGRAPSYAARWSDHAPVVVDYDV